MISGMMRTPMLREESNQMTFEVWMNFRSPDITKNNWKRYQEFLTLEGFKRRSWSGSLNKNKKTHSFISKHADESLRFTNHAKHLVRAYFIFKNFSKTGSYYL